MAGKIMTRIPSAANVVEDGTGSTTAPVTSVINPGAGKAACVGQVSWSYSADPTGGSITLSDGTTTLAWYVAKAGPGFIVFNPPVRFAVGATVTGTVADGGNGVNRSIHVVGWADGAV
jgi:hypothetical protein